MSIALVVVDLQRDYFPGGSMELVGIGKAAGNARRLLSAFRDKGLAVVHVQHIAARPNATFFLPGTKGAEIHDLVAPVQGEAVVTKYYPNSFRDTNLLDVLKANGTDSLVICGAMSHMCIDATTRAAFDLGFRCIVAEDACATRDLVFGDRTVKAADVHASFMAALSMPYARVIAAKEAVAEIV
ncbi:MAG: cysteine hydrolase family protein [Lentisphaeria bacterium]|jgi:nicotinamidase-related amidase|nr:cysteine hydrolase family protein [Lentisphaeria bacterium]